MKRQNGPKRIVIRFKGGLGNQIYQLAAGLLISKVTGAGISSSDIYYRYKENTREKAIESVYDGKIPRESETLLDLVFSKAAGRCLRENRLARNHRLGRVVVSDSDFLEWISEGFVKTKWSERIVVLDGYFQNAYSLENSGVLSDLSALAPTSENEIGIHIRLGDYLQAPYNSLYQVVNEEFIRESYDHLVRYGGICANAKVRLFSNSMNDARALVERALPSVEVISAGGRSTVADLRELAGHRNLILSNSSYSLLAWHLSSTAQAVVPSNWFKSSKTPLELFSKNPRLHRMEIPLG